MLFKLDYVSGHLRIRLTILTRLTLSNANYMYDVVISKYLSKQQMAQS